MTAQLHFLDVANILGDKGCSYTIRFAIETPSKYESVYFSHVLTLQALYRIKMRYIYGLKSVRKPAP